jgi:putative transposase
MLHESVEYRRLLGQWFPLLMVLMPDHVHMLLRFPLSVRMKKVVSDWKQYTAKRIDIRWQRDFFEHRLRSDESLMEKAAYIRNNPVRKQLVDVPTAWPYTWSWENNW